MASTNIHNQEIHRNAAKWTRKPLLREVYRGFYCKIAEHLPEHSHGFVVELGSGVPNIREVIHDCLRTDIFPNDWIDRVENAYSLSFEDSSVSALILFDVFHHLQYPGEAFKEFRRVLASSGRVLIFEPCLSLLGRVVYGLLHKEPLGTHDKIQWYSPEGWSSQQAGYYAAQGNASRIFLRKEINLGDYGWNVISIERISSLSYVLSGGYTGPQIYPYCILPIMRRIDHILGYMPELFSTRLLAVLGKVDHTKNSQGEG